MVKISQSEVLRRFDHLAAKGELHYAEPEVTHYSDEGFLVEFCVTKAYNAKPQLGEPGTLETNPKAPRALDSDIDHADPAFHIDDIEETHKLILNKYCVFRPQYLLLTRDPSAKQSSPLDEHDFAAAWNILNGAPPGIRYWIMFNCGRHGGSSRRHKHMQVFEGPGAHSNPGNTTPLLGDRPEDHQHVPFQMYYKNITGHFDGTHSGIAGEGLAEYYEHHLRLSKEALKSTVPQYEAGEWQDDYVPHNFLMTLDWMMTIPRREVSVEDLSPVSAAGMIGRVWLTGQDPLAKWKAIGPRNILKTVGVPSQ